MAEAFAISLDDKGAHVQLMKSITQTGPKLPAGSNLLNADKAARQHFDALTRQEVIQAIWRMADNGTSDGLIAAATKLSVEMVRQILVKRE